MNSKFYCPNCKLEFEADGKKVEYQDRVYGPCWKRVANCPACHQESNEKSSLGDSSKNFDELVESLNSQSRGGCCGGGGCCG